jgi:cytoskeleton protein RodZ
MESLGNDLKSARNKRNLPLEQIADETRISARYLRALEEGRYGDLPGGMYNRAFLRTYCEFLGVDAKVFLQRYEADTASTGEKPQKAKGKAFRPASYPQPHPLAIWSILLGVTIAGLYFSRSWITAVFSPYFSRPPASKIETNREAPPSAPPAQTAPGAASPNSSPATAAPPPAADATKNSAASGQLPTANAPAPPPMASPSTAGAEKAPTTFENALTAKAPVTPGEQPSSKPIQVRLRAVQECWASVSSDGNVVLKKMLRPGDDQSFGASERIIVVLGNAAGVRLTINGQTAKPLGKMGEVVRVSIDEKTIPELLEKTTG